MTLARTRALIERHTVLTFVALTMLWSGGIWSFMFLYIEPGGLLHNPPPICFLFVVVGGFGPALSGLCVTWITQGRAGVRSLWERARNVRAGRWWWALLIIPSVTALTPIARWLAGYPVDTAVMLRLVGPGIALGITAGLMEELGWRGFLLPRLLRRFRPLTATLVLGAIWGGLWHGYADYFALGGRGVESLTLIVLLGPVLLTAWSLVITRVYEHTRGSLAVALGMHASISSSALVFGQSYATGSEEVTWTAISVGIAVVASGALWLLVAPPAHRNHQDHDSRSGLRDTQ